MIGSAIAQFPEGNEDWSNMMEASYPIAAWIASPPKTRWHRWQRLRSRLDSEWIALLDLEYLPLERLAEVADEAPQRVLGIFADELRLLLHNNSEIALPRDLLCFLRIALLELSRSFLFLLSFL